MFGGKADTRFPSNADTSFQPEVTHGSLHEGHALKKSGHKPESWQLSSTNIVNSSASYQFHIGSTDKIRSNGKSAIRNTKTVEQSPSQSTRSFSLHSEHINFISNQSSPEPRLNAVMIPATSKAFFQHSTPPSSTLGEINVLKRPVTQVATVSPFQLATQFPRYAVGSLDNPHTSSSPSRHRPRRKAGALRSKTAAADDVDSTVLLSSLSLSSSSDGAAIAPSAEPAASWASLSELVRSHVEPIVTVLNCRMLMAEAHPHPHTLLSGSYHWVICKASGSDDSMRDLFCRTTHTQFGAGVELELLTGTALQEAFSDKAESDSVTVCVGVVHSRRVYQTSDPFVTHAWQHSKGSAEIAEAMSGAIINAMKHVFDAVEFTPRGQKKGSERKYLISWEAGTAVPLAVLTIQQKAECKVCFDSYSNADGFSCPRKCGTFTCWDCLLQSYAMAVQPGAIQGGSNPDGELLCSDNQCKCPIKVVDLARSSAAEAVLQAQEDFKVHTLTTKKVAEALSQQEGRIRAEYARIEQIKDVDEKTAAKLRLKIVDEVLTLRCPRCKAAFADFEGCFALRCGNNSCRCGFCAWCLKDCGSSADTHAHVKVCPENERGTYFNTEEAFQQHHKKKRIAAIKKLLTEAGLSTGATNKLRDMLGRDLKDLGINLNDVFASPSPDTAAVAEDDRRRMVRAERRPLAHAPHRVVLVPGDGPAAPLPQPFLPPQVHFNFFPQMPFLFPREVNPLNNVGRVHAVPFLPQAPLQAHQRPDPFHLHFFGDYVFDD